MKNFDYEIFSRVIDYDLVKVARAAAILKEDICRAPAGALQISPFNSSVLRATR